MPNFNVYEPKSVYDELLENHDIAVGDTITYNSNNQQGYKKYKVINGDNGDKALTLIDSYAMREQRYAFQSDDESSDAEDTTTDGNSNKRQKTSGGKKRRRTNRRRTNRRRTNRRRSRRQKR